MSVRDQTGPAVPTAPGRLPGLGHTVQLYRRPLEFLASLTALGDVVRVYLGPLPAYVLTAPDVVRQVLHDGGQNFDKGRLFERSRPLVGQGLLTAQPQLHRIQRPMIQPAFHRARIAQYTATMRAAAEETMAAWQPGQTVAIDRAMTDLTLSVIARTLFSAPPGSAAFTEVHQTLPVFVSGAGLRALLPAWLLRLPLPANRRFTDAVARLLALTDQAVSSHSSTPNRPDGADGPDGPEDVLSLLLQARDEHGRAMSAQQLRDEVLTLIIAGTETSQAALTWALHLTATHPTVEQRLHEEVDTVLEGRPVTFTDLPHLPHTTRIVNEVLRLYPPWLLMRRALRPVTLGPARLPAGTEIIYSPYLLHHDPRHFPDPDRFDPDRWLTDRARTLPRGAYIPFGAGPRKCIGDSFAAAQATTVLATLAAQWTLRPHTSTPAIPRPTGPLIRPPELRMSVLPRHPHPTSPGEDRAPAS
ncbi:cytochrome P450 [Streptomyces cyaneus]|uniref:cytochrome P450 n=1 Tax=Streptomyces cyaneus TaxID=1904 RepID=UPI0013E2ACAF|nr:cytochrome P450 [Streptomyces cyaneus]